MAWFFEFFRFFASGVGALATLCIAGAMILLWDWRAALVGAVLIQVSLATTAVHVHATPAAWATAHILTMLIACLILGLSMAQVNTSRSLSQAGNWLLRLLTVGTVLACWRLIRVGVLLPHFSESQTLFLILLIVCELILLSLGDNPLFTVVGLLLWISTVQLVIEALLPLPGVIALIGVSQLLLALTGSYLILADRVPHRAAQVIITDITFPDALSPVAALEADDSVDTAPLPMLPSRLLTRKPDTGGEPKALPGSSVRG